MNKQTFLANSLQNLSVFLGSGGETDFTQIMQLHYCAVTLPKYVISISGKFCEGDVYLKNTNPWVMA